MPSLIATADVCSVCLLVNEGDGVLAGPAAARHAVAEVGGDDARLSGRARQAGICRFTATVAHGNAAMAALLQNMGAELAGHGPGTVDYEVVLDRAGEYSLDWWFRCVDDDPVLNSR